MKPLLTLSLLAALAAVPGPARAQIKVTNLAVNTAADEDDPHLSSDGLALFYTATAKKKSDILVSRHMITKHGNVADAYGVHFRWAAGLRIESDTSLKAYATQRNFVGAQFSINSFPPK